MIGNLFSKGHTETLKFYHYKKPKIEWEVMLMFVCVPPRRAAIYDLIQDRRNGDSRDQPATGRPSPASHFVEACPHYPRTLRRQGVIGFDRGARSSGCDRSCVSQTRRCRVAEQWRACGTEDQPCTFSCCRHAGTRGDATICGAFVDSQTDDIARRLRSAA